MGDRLLVDGGVIDRIPVSVVKSLGADLVIAVDVSPIKVQGEVTTIYDVIMQSIEIMQHELVHHRQTASDLMMHPAVERFNSRAFTDLEEIIAVGEDEARKHVDAIRALIENWKEQKKMVFKRLRYLFVFFCWLLYLRLALRMYRCRIILRSRG
ncbi:hypothetical protein GCM10020331_045280 [Ectobacillus funiculus]